MLFRSILPSDTFEVTSDNVEDTFRVMEVELTVLGADTVTVTFVRPDDPDEEIVVKNFHW